MSCENKTPKYRLGYLGGFLVNITDEDFEAITKAFLWSSAAISGKSYIYLTDRFKLSKTGQDRIKMSEIKARPKLFKYLAQVKVLQFIPAKHREDLFKVDVATNIGWNAYHKAKNANWYPTDFKDLCPEVANNIKQNVLESRFGPEPAIKYLDRISYVAALTIGWECAHFEETKGM